MTDLHTKTLIGLYRPIIIDAINTYFSDETDAQLKRILIHAINAGFNMVEASAAEFETTCRKLDRAKQVILRNAHRLSSADINALVMSEIVTPLEVAEFTRQARLSNKGKGSRKQKKNAKRRAQA